MTQDDSIVQFIADRLAEAFEAGIAPWSRPSRLGFACGLPANARTGRTYTGLIGSLLEIIAIEGGYGSRFWGTTQDWLDLGGTIPSGIGDTLLNADQVGIRLTEDRRAPDYDRARRLVAATGARIRSDVRPYYRRIGAFDWIGMPPESWCEGGPDEWWSVHFHELIHWAMYGTERLGVECEYSHGELIAEMGAALLADRFGIKMRGDLSVHGDHVQAWVRGMKADAKYLTNACELSGTAAVYVLALGGEEPFVRSPTPTILKDLHRETRG